MKKLTVGIATIAFTVGTLACGGAKKDATDATQADDAAPKKGLEKFEGNKMEKSDDEEE
jgi:hypothetical protein